MMLLTDNGRLPYQQYFEDNFPKGLAIVKQVSETK
jgi:hypothetical protein